ncbi:hypothetical protein F5B17DRAFT_431472 [Nemania serpens]|nr:hypothetical protein F5B17DRAFT_431472 [Nemania serpens]
MPTCLPAIGNSSSYPFQCPPSILTRIAVVCSAKSNRSSTLGDIDLDEATMSNPEELLEEKRSQTRIIIYSSLVYSADLAVPAVCPSITSRLDPVPRPKTHQAMKLSAALVLFSAALAFGQAQTCTPEMIASDDCAAVIDANACYNAFRWNAQTLQCIDGKDNADRQRKSNSLQPWSSLVSKLSTSTLPTTLKFIAFLTPSLKMPQTVYRAPWPYWLPTLTSCPLVIAWVTLMFKQGATSPTALSLGAACILVRFLFTVLDPDTTIESHKALPDGTVVDVRRPLVGFKRYEEPLGVTGGYEVRYDGYRYEPAYIRI